MSDWRDIEESGGSYMVSSLGEVKSIERTVTRSNGVKHFVRERIMRSAKDKKGYLRYGLTINGRLQTRKAHRLVAAAFISKDIDGMTIDHVDGNKENNSVENLEIVSSSENTRRSFANGLQPKVPSGFDNPRSKLNKAQVRLIRECYHAPINKGRKPKEMPFSMNWLAKAFRINRKTMGKIIANKAYIDG